MQFFKSTTLTPPKEGKVNAVIMGRKTWQSIPTKFKPLDGRINVILTENNADEVRSEVAMCKQTFVQPSLLAALRFLQSAPEVSEQVGAIFVIGGSALYRASLASPLCHRVYRTRVLREFECDTFIPELDCQKTWHLSQVGDVQVSEDATAAAGAAPIPFQFQTLDRRVKHHEVGNPEEQQYLDLVRRVIETGVRKGDRTGTGTLSLFGAQMRFSLRNGRFPLLTSKRVFWRGVVEELIWLTRGCTDSKVLAEKTVHIWDDNGARAFLDKLGFNDREEGDLGPVRSLEKRRTRACIETAACVARCH
jgi:dihydrofolate reductase/thymidylate synthase